MGNVLKKCIQAALGSFGLTIVRKQRAIQARATEPPQVLDDPIDCLFEARGGKVFAFKAPISACINAAGFGFGAAQWHPYVAMLREHSTFSTKSFEDSVLARYGTAYECSSAADAIPGFAHAPETFRQLPPYLYLLHPWSALSVPEQTAQIRAWYDRHNRMYGTHFLDLDLDGLHSPRKLQMEFHRHIKVFASIRKNGYDRKQGDISVLLLKRADQEMFLVQHGHHRSAALAALGHASIPVVHQFPWIVDVADVEKWPQVKSGLWPRECAIAYFDHLFTFDSKLWAQERGLVPAIE